jgi:hypothetical protein
MVAMANRNTKAKGMQTTRRIITTFLSLACKLPQDERHERAIPNRVKPDPKKALELDRILCEYTPFTRQPENPWAT